MIKQLWKSIHRWLIDHPLRPGDKIGHTYRVDELLGMGSYGMTYVVSIQGSHQKFVAKQLRKTKQKTMQGKQSFKQEVTILQALHHPQIPTIHEWLEDKGNLFIIMEYVEGKTFEDLIFEEGKTYSEREALHVLLQVIDVVDYIHQQGIVHRDLRIPNILLVKEEIVIIDFGLARFTDQKEDVSTLVDEQQRMREIAFKSDIYTLGHFLLFLLYSSYEPISQKEKSWEKELLLSSPLTHIIRKMLQHDQPYEELHELKEDVQHYLKNR
ncbi:protein kinase [Bacillus sp. CGMCC 1.16541]|uniref:serine/threonine protein kinase n=1 Tax=Bacillus sp. CGMCC 1.16541 TaxID=2185143 RepID=UPI001951E2C5|nr:protein kinase [Bacillus sp. CGMCC 1.16541]